MACYEWSEMRFTRRIFCGALLLSLLAGSSHVLAQNARQPALAEGSHADCARLRAELDRVNAEIAALKRAERNVRNEYTLREKMADAEALARRLTDAERLARDLRPATAAPALIVAPAAAPQDGAVELEAKADLMADQAHRFAIEADNLARTAEEIRNRQALRRRASNLDRDPFAGFEGSKRSLVVQQQRSLSTVSGTKGAPNSNGASDSWSGSTGSESAKSGDSATDRGSTTSPVQGTTSDFGSGTTGALPGSSGPNPSTTVNPSPVPSTSPSAASPLAPVVAPGVLSRTLLDPASLADIRQSLSASGSLSDPDALEAAATALRQRARLLREQASALRVRARQH